jgi:hypothetical protein
MAYREVRVVEVREVLRLWLRGEGQRPIAESAGVDRKTVRRYVDAAVELGLTRDGGEGQLSDEFIGGVLEGVRPHRADGRGEGWQGPFIRSAGAPDEPGACRLAGRRCFRRQTASGPRDGSVPVAPAAFRSTRSW